MNDRQRKIVKALTQMAWADHRWSIDDAELDQLRQEALRMRAAWES